MVALSLVLIWIARKSFEVTEAMVTIGATMLEPVFVKRKSLFSAHGYLGSLFRVGAL